MIIDLARLKSKLGITDDTHDEDLTAVIAEQTAWVEGETHRRFDAPILVTETIVGSGRTTLWLGGHIELDNEDEPTWGTVSVTERVAFAEPELLDPLSYSVRGGTSLASIVRVDGFLWSRGAEYDVTYYDGYAVPPADIQALIYSLATTAYRMDESTADASAGITSESLVGVYSYSIDRQHATLESSGELSDLSKRTINRWKRTFV